MDALQPLDHNLAAVELDIGDELDRYVHRIAEQVRVHLKTQLELGLVDALVACDTDRVRQQARLVVAKYGLNLVGDIAQGQLVDRAVGNIGKSKIQHRLAGIIKPVQVVIRLER